MICTMFGSICGFSRRIKELEEKNSGLREDIRLLRADKKELEKRVKNLLLKCSDQEEEDCTACEEVMAEATGILEEVLKFYGKR